MSTHTEEPLPHRSKRRRLADSEYESELAIPSNHDDLSSDSDAQPSEPSRKTHEDEGSSIPPDDEDLFLSEVHIDPSNGPARTHGESLRLTKFRINVPRGYHGDIPPFLQTGDPAYICIEHEMATPLRAVGLQVWMGALVLADYVLSRYKHIKPVESAKRKGGVGSDAEAADDEILFTSQTTVLELGCGAGLLAALCGKLCRTVYATDVCDDLAAEDRGDDVGVLRLCQRNMVKNHVDSVLRVRRLDLRDEECPKLGSNVEAITSQEVPQQSNGGSFVDFRWRPSEISDFQQNCTIILAADLIYDDAVTFAFLQRLPALLHPCPTAESKHPKSKQLLLALEKRVVFSLRDQNVAAPARDYLLATLDAMNADREERGLSDVVRYEEIDVDAIPQWFEYRRNEYLEMWRFWIE
ncbi:uncharacterized protein EV422DRAFT_506543 [Fimicolochytrium jonesii]|uniref:uncharacterized protein n=1 Tax=Fimicolochytrium jonesii TaxID=1396493 RepID=UPI0022FE342E|nr:uncharacterized protein EV422DRAFT_506543 [Fimicolochytrium jonesii]KAI8820821.1 hypothetical protein EV422DRAFT_506543 [Fimicolochytrium jonesii]